MTLIIGFPKNIIAEEGIFRRALLVGITKYPNVGKEFELNGGNNDVDVISKVLIEKFGFKKQDITILSEKLGQKDINKLPTKKNIEEAFIKLATGVCEGEQVVVFLAGHGTELPTSTGPAGHFLPRDVSPWKGEKGNGLVPNAIPGTEIGAWLRPIAEKKANLWLIVDACFTGRMVRGGSITKVRQIPTDPKIKGGLQVPLEAFQQEARRGGSVQKSLIPLPDYDNVACMYACNPDEVTLEEPAISGDQNSPIIGLFTRSLGEILLNSSSIPTYRELNGRIVKLIAASGRNSPTPLVEGGAVNKQVLRQKVIQQNSFIVSETDEGNLTINAGFLHGVTLGSLLSVFPPPGQGDDQRGLLKIIRIDPANSIGEPYEDEFGQIAKKAILINGRAELFRLNYSKNLINIGIDPINLNGQNVPVDLLMQVKKMLLDIVNPINQPFRFTESLAEANLVLKFNEKDVCFTDLNFSDSKVKHTLPIQTFHKIDENLYPWLKTKLEQIGRGKALLRLHAEAARDPSIRLRVNLLKVATENSTTGNKIEGALKTVHVKDFVAFDLRNESDVPIDVTILYLDSNFEIDAVFPVKGEKNRITPGEALQPLIISKISNKTLGYEYAVVIAVENKGNDPIEFTALSPTRRSLATSQKQIETPLGRMLSDSVLGGGTKRSVNQNLFQSYAVDLLPLEILP